MLLIFTVQGIMNFIQVGECMSKRLLLIGASGEIGKAIARDAVKQGYSLILHYHSNEQTMKDLVQELPVDTIEAIIQADLTSHKGVQGILERVAAFTIDAIVFASGTASYGLFQDCSHKDRENMLYLHVQAPLEITQALLPAMIREQQGRILFITSIWGSVGASNEVLYSTVKGAQNSFILALSKEMGPSGIYVNGVSPGFIDTKMNAHIAVEERQAIEDDIPLQRAGTSEEVAHVVSFLLDERSSYIQ